MDWGLLGSSVHGILQARILEWVAISFSRGSSWPRDCTPVSCTAGRFFTVWATKDTTYINVSLLIKETIQGSHTLKNTKPLGSTFTLKMEKNTFLAFFTQVEIKRISWTKGRHTRAEATFYLWQSLWQIKYLACTGQAINIGGVNEWFSTLA